MEYAVIEEVDSAKFAKKVNEMLKKGFELNGNLVAAPIILENQRPYIMFIQALTKGPKKN